MEKVSVVMVINGLGENKSSTYCILSNLTKFMISLFCSLDNASLKIFRSFIITTDLRKASGECQVFARN